MGASETVRPPAPQVHRAESQKGSHVPKGPQGSVVRGPPGQGRRAPQQRGRPPLPPAPPWEHTFPQGHGQDGSPGLEAFQRAKSLGDRFSLRRSAETLRSPADTRKRVTQCRRPDPAGHLDLPAGLYWTEPCHYEDTSGGY